MQNHESSNFTDSRRSPSNKGKLVGAKPPLRPKHVWSIRTQLRVEGRTRDLAMFNLARQQAARLRRGQPEGRGRHAARTSRRPRDRRQRKTGQPVRFELTELTREAVDVHIKATGKKPGQFLFAGRRGSDQAITTRQYARLVSRWISGIGLDPSFFGTHSLRRTKATLICRGTGNLRAVQLLLGHTKIESTRQVSRY